MVASLVPNEDEVMLRDAARGFLQESSPVTAFRANRDAGRTYYPGPWKDCLLYPSGPPDEARKLYSGCRRIHDKRKRGSRT